MPKIDIDGIIREMTEEEILQESSFVPPQMPKSTEERVAELEEAIDLLLGGVTNE